MFTGQSSSMSTLEWPQPCRQFTFSEIETATKNFNKSLVIGRGGFGKVYKGAILSTGAKPTPLVVAIKKLDSTSNQGSKEFWVEVDMLSKLRHCNLVSLIGYCNDGTELILVYEYMPHGTLEHHLHNRLNPPTWMRRLRICTGAARGLDYLHTGTGIKHGVIHRDVKSSNILLHDSWTAKISDFGLSKVGPTNQQSTYVNTLVKGTFGYLDPDYFQTGRLTRKSDVYAFGVVLFEVLCGKSAVITTDDEEQQGFVTWIQDSIKEGRLKEIVDPNIRRSIYPKCLKEFARLAERCLHNHPKQRPTMAEIVVVLESILASQDKINNVMHPKTSFGRMMPIFLFPSNGKRRNLYQFDFLTISVATENFCETNDFFLYASDFMYKGRLQNGQRIAIRKLHYPTQEDIFINVRLQAKLEHKNLVQLLGYCLEGTTVFLVYDFALYKSLDDIISGPLMPTLLDWNKRYEIILGVADALAYLHKRALHTYVCPRTILFDESMDHKLSYFGESFLPLSETDCIMANAITGIYGYIAVEYDKAVKYGMNHHLSTKADVFGFGMSVLVTISGQSPTNKELPHHFWRHWSEGKHADISDPTIDAADSSLISRLIQIGLLCIQEDFADRPTMDDVVMLLNTSSHSVPLPKKPVGFYMDKKSDDALENSDDNSVYSYGTDEDFESELSPR